MIHLDTHVAVWMALADERRLSATARRLLDRNALAISPMVLLELEVLWEAGKLRNEPARLVSRLTDALALDMSQAPFGDIVESARAFAWTRDVFDRLIVANAMADGARLLTADQLILGSFRDAVW